jgi:hypothetical protein
VGQGATLRQLKKSMVNIWRAGESSGFGYWKSVSNSVGARAPAFSQRTPSHLLQIFFSSAC